MRCRIIKKFLPLYIGGDLLFFHHRVEKHLESCSNCRKLYETYASHRINIRKLANPEIPPKILENYWEDLVTKLEQQPSTIVKPNNNLTLLIFRPIMALAVIFICAFLFGKYWVTQDNMGQKNSPISTSISGVSMFPIPKYSEIFLRQRDDNITTEYHLEQVELLPVENVAF